MSEPITWFFDGPYRFLDNFYDAPAEYNGRVYPTVEHGFQAAKPVDPAVAELIATADDPGTAKQLGNTCELRPDWEDVKQDVMLALLRSKFSNAKLQKRLLDTGDRELIEGNSWHDNIWGDCECGRCINIPGQNLLGKFLMQIREEFSNQ